MLVEQDWFRGLDNCDHSLCYELWLCPQSPMQRLAQSDAHQCHRHSFDDPAQPTGPSSSSPFDGKQVPFVPFIWIGKSGAVKWMIPFICCRIMRLKQRNKAQQISRRVIFQERGEAEGNLMLVERDLREVSGLLEQRGLQLRESISSDEKTRARLIKTINPEQQQRDAAESLKEGVKVLEANVKLSEEELRRTQGSLEQAEEMLRELRGRSFFSFFYNSQP